ncbi:MAG: signal peptide peptidase SppA [Candidatus Krumholzibacteriota bacterium]|nr:signal peptide peptidase SppA [Candidatus Krumholzibacteriota bacterium]
MKSFFRAFLASFLAIVVVILVVVGVVASKANEKSKIEDHSWLVIDIYGDVTEFDPPGGILSEVMGGKPETLQRILSNLEKVRHDDRIDGVILKLSSANNLGAAKMEEIRGAVGAVRASGKKVYGWADSMDRGTYYLAAACDSIYMPPTGYIQFLGFYRGSIHAKSMLEKLGINPNVHKIKDYKSAAEMVTRTDMSGPARENDMWMLDEYWDMYVSAIEADRGITELELVEIMNHAQFLPEAAVEFGLVDRLLYWDELDAMLRQEDDEKLNVVSQGRYADEEPKDLGFNDGKKKIVVIHAQGMIGGRVNKVDPLFGIMMGHETINAEFRRARRDEDVAAIVFRVDSGGGESLASDLMSREADITADEKPVVVSMVDVAASGGYMISYRASRIVADPTTLTGSIGSISMKFNMKGFFEKLGITADAATKGPHALMWSSFSDFTEEEWDIFTKDHWKGFNAWLADVADRRGMTFEEAEKLAHGRVWTGRQAKKNGLVDELGGLDRAIEIAREMAEIPGDEEVTVEHWPKRKGLLESITSGQGSLSAVTRYVVWRMIRTDVAETWRTVAEGRLDALATVPAE